jgi:peptidoglycan/xylan/chitin deacetylase (PgdA/CDA1 family)
VDSSIAKRRIKAGLGHLVYRSGLHTLAWRHRAMIVLFHRVDDRYPRDGITCSRAQFVALCDFFARYFEVIPLSELLELLRRRVDVSRRLVITFDDGYRDNHQFAAVELRKRGLPACFFIATGFIGSDQSAWWDAQQSIRSEWMSWDDVRSLRDQGFELGAHTVTHPDLGRLARAEAEREIAGSKVELEARVGTRIVFFSYPFGNPEHMSEDNRAVVRDAGFSCCLSAHGGTVRAADNAFRLKRFPINMWQLSPYQFGSEAIRAVVVGAGT